jgi:DNA-binding FrmR family transcriptional regulator
MRSSQHSCLYNRTRQGYTIGMAGYIAHRDDIQKRLRRIEGQARGLQRMVDDERYCIDILTQVKSLKAALDRVALLLLDDHVAHCVNDAAQAGDRGEKLREVSLAIGRFVEG